MLFGMALDLWEEYHTGAVVDFEDRAAELRFAVSHQLRERALRDWDNQHLLKVLRQGLPAKCPNALKTRLEPMPFPPSRAWFRPC
jgi:hypothetical protein